MPQVANSPNTRFLELDCLRGIAALAVVLYHYTFYYDTRYGHDIPVIPWLDLFKHGVNLFFVVSGFVIYMTLERTASIKDFIVSRFSRLYPAYWAAAAVTFTIVWLFGLPGLEVSPGEALVNITMIQRLLGVPHIDNSYWTLTYELGFYIFMGTAFVVGATKRPWLLCWVYLIVQALVIAGVKAGIGNPESLMKLALIPYGHQFMVGIALYCLTKNRSLLWPHFVIGSSLGMELLLGRGVGGPIEPDPPVYAGILAVFYLFAFGRLGFIVNSLLLYLGRISYSLYLIHQHVGYVIIRSFTSQGMPAYAAILVAFICALLLAVGIHHLIERPALQFIRNRYRKRH